ncbi:MAG: DUF5685 family protein [bacterium]|nr:DUF5685 family protein [bacterium]
MFGYIHANTKELTEVNKITYQAYYCGLCRQLKQSCGKKGQMLLNYDMTFLVILLSGLYELENTHEAFNCVRHPGRRQNVWINDATRYAADMSILLSYHNCLDDWRDEHSVAKRMIVKALQDDYERIGAQYPRQLHALEDYMKQLAAAEARQETNIDLVAGLTGQMLAELFDWKQDEWSEELRWFGFYMGKFIYLMDAYEDLEKDRKNKQYNILSYIADGREYEIYCKQLLTSMVAECAKSFERLPILQHADILRNVLYSGVWTRYEYLQLKRQKQELKEKKAAAARRTKNLKKQSKKRTN